MKKKMIQAKTKQKKLLWSFTLGSLLLCSLTPLAMSVVSELLTRLIFLAEKA